MKVTITILSVFTLLFTSCNFSTKRIIPSTETIEYEVPITDISSLRVSGIYEVYVRIGAEEKLMINCNENLKEYLKITDNGKSLLLKMDNISASSGIILKAYLTVVDLNSINCSGAVKVQLEKARLKEMAIDLSGASQITSKGLETESLSIESSGAASVAFTNVNAKETELDASGASSIELSGITDELTAEFSGASHLKAGQLMILKNGIFDGSGASGFKITTNGNLSAELSGASKLMYSGTPKNIDKRLSGAATLVAE